MDEIINCPSCRRKLQLPESYMGKQVQCPSCEETFVAQAGGAPYNPPAPSAPAPGPSSYPPDPAPPRDEYPPEDDYPPRRRRRRPRYDDDYEYDEYRPRRRRAYMVPHRGGGILAMGIISIFTCIALGIIAWVMAHNDLNEMRAGRMDPSGEGQTRAGMICGIVGTFLHVVFGCLWMFAILQDGPRRW